MPYKDPQKQKEAQQRSYLRNRERIREQRCSPEAREARKVGRVKRYKENVEVVRRAKKVPCADCGHDYPHYVMDFDHVRGEKVASVSALLSNGFALEHVLEEIAKCDVVCANCHRQRTHERSKQRRHT